MEEQEDCPDSTVMMDDEEELEEEEMATIPFSHRRSIDEPQSSRISSTFTSGGNFAGVPQLPPLPKLILRPPVLGSHYPSVSFASSQPRGGSSSALSRVDSQVPSPRVSTVPSSSSSGSKITLTPAPPVSSSGGRGNMPLPALPRLEQMSRSELTISRVGSSSSATSSGSRAGVSSSSRNEFGRIGGVSISRVDGSTPMSRAGTSSSGQMAKRIAIPALHRIGGSRSASAATGVQQGGDLSSRKFGRRFLKSSPVASVSSTSKSQLQKMPLSIMRAASTEEYYSTPRPATSGRLSTDDISPTSMHNEAGVHFVESGRKHGSFGSVSTPVAAVVPSRKSALASAEMLTSQQGSQGIKLHISKPRGRPVKVIDVEESIHERNFLPMGTSVHKKVSSDPDDSGIPFHNFSPSNLKKVSASARNIGNEEIAVNPLSLMERLKIPSGLIIDEAEVDDEDDAATKDMSESMYESTPCTTVEDSSFLQQLMLKNPVGNLLPVHTPGNNMIRRTRRKRESLPVSTNETPVKVRRRRGGAVGTSLSPQSATITSMSQAAIMVTSEVVSGTVSMTPRGRGRGTGRGRGRPRGSTNKAKMEREQAQRDLLLQQQLQANLEVEAPESEDVLKTPEKTDELENTSKVETTATDATPSLSQPPLSPLPLEGDPKVNSEIQNIHSTPVKTRKPRGSRGRGQGNPRGGGTPVATTPSPTRGGRGTRTPRGSKKKSPEGKKPKIEKNEKEREAVTAPTVVQPETVQLLDEETRMSADIKPPIPDRVSALATPVVMDEESRASNVSSTSTSTTAKAKRFTKDPIEERKPVTAETLYEYQWPVNDKNAEFYFLQEQISEYLGVKSFKRKYPDIRRRIVDMEERDFLRNSKVVSETQCDLGLTAVHSCDVLDIMFNDFNEKYEEYRKVFQERKEAEMVKLKPQNGTEPAVVRDRSAEFMRRILKSCAKWNLGNNRDRQEQRKCSYDLQTNTFHFPKTNFTVMPPERTKMGKFPVAVLPGQFTDNFKKYTSDELFYLPLNSVRYGPIRESDLAEPISSDSDSDSDGSSSSDDSSSSSDDDIGSANDQNAIVLLDEVGNQLYRGMPGPTKVSTEAKCKTCEGGSSTNKDKNPEVLLHCSRCDVANHPTCLELTLDMLPFITKYLWECTECKNCIQCNDPADEDKMLFCDCCDRGYHIYCVGLRKVPTGRWHCSVCAVCYSCGTTQPSQDDRMAEWHHEYRKGEKGAKFYLHSFCVACHKLHKKGQFCPSCHKVHTKLDKDILMECRKCEKWVHKACVKRRPLKSMFGFMCDPCDANFRSRSSLPSHVK